MYLRVILSLNSPCGDRGTE